MRYLSLLTLLAVLGACAPAGEDSVLGEPLNGRWLVVNYWAEWCKPCREEIPELNRLAAEKSELVAVLGVNYDGFTGPELEAASSALGLEFRSTGEDPAAQLLVDRPKVLPTTYIFNPQGKLAHTLVGPQHYADLVALISPPATEEVNY